MSKHGTKISWTPKLPHAAMHQPLHGTHHARIGETMQQMMKESGQTQHHSRTDQTTAGKDKSITQAFTQGTAANLKLVLGELKVQSLQVALDVGDAGGLGDDTGAVLDGPPDQHLGSQTHQSASASTQHHLGEKSNTPTETL